MTSVRSIGEKEEGMTDANDLNSSRREFVRSAVSGMALAAAPAAVLAAAAGKDADKAAVLAQSRRCMPRT